MKDTVFSLLLSGIVEKKTRFPSTGFFFLNFVLHSNHLPRVRAFRFLGIHLPNHVFGNFHGIALEGSEHFKLKSLMSQSQSNSGLEDHLGNKCHFLQSWGQKIIYSIKNLKHKAILDDHLPIIYSHMMSFYSYKHTSASASLLLNNVTI